MVLIPVKASSALSCSRKTQITSKLVALSDCQVVNIVTVFRLEVAFKDYFFPNVPPTIGP